MAKTDITVERVRDLLSYDCTTGLFTWLKTLSNRAVAGTRAGANRGGGYRRISIDGVLVYEHHLAWLLCHGVWPSDTIDHIDGNPSNNAIENLRVGSHAENCQNFGLRKTNTSGHTGVSWHRPRSRWCAYIFKDCKKIHLGLFDTKADAAAAYARAKAELHTFQPVLRDA